MTGGSIAGAPIIRDYGKHYTFGIRFLAERITPAREGRPDTKNIQWCDRFSSTAPRCRRKRLMLGTRHVPRRQILYMLPCDADLAASPTVRISSETTELDANLSRE